MTAGSGQVQLPRSLDNELVQLLHKATSARIVELAGTRQLKIFVMVSIKNYKNLRKLARLRNRVQAISGALDGAVQRAPGTGLKQQAIEESVPYTDIIEAQASSTKRFKRQATSLKPQATSLKRQAASFKLQDS